MNKAGKVIAVHGGYLHGAGVSTITLSLAICMHSITENKKILVICLDNERSLFDKFIEKDVELRHSLDDIKIYESKLTPEIIENHADIINDNLYIIRRSKAGKISSEFVHKIIKEAEKCFDLIFIDAGNNGNEEAIINADIKVLVTEYNDLVLEDVSTYKDIIVFNKFPEEYSSNLTIGEFKEKYQITNEAFAVNYNTTAFTEMCEKRALYSFIMRNLSNKNIFVNNVMEVVQHIADMLKIKVQKKYEKKGLIRRWRIKA